MDTIEIRGIVIKEVFVGEADKILTLLGKDLGKISVSVKGARNAKSKLAAGTSLFSYCDYVLKKKKKYYYIEQADIIKSFYNIRTDLDRLAYASYFVEFADKLLPEEMSSNNIMLLLLKSLNAVSKGIVLNKVAARVFELKFLQYSGYSPEFSRCVLCGETYGEYFFVSNEGLLCPKCKKNHREYDYPIIKIDLNVVYTVNYILNSDIDNLFSFNLSDDILKKLASVNKKILSFHFNYNLKSYNFISELEKEIGHNLP